MKHYFNEEGGWGLDIHCYDVRISMQQGVQKKLEAEKEELELRNRKLWDMSLLIQKEKLHNIRVTETSR